MKIGIDAGIVSIVEQEIASILCDEGLHRVAVVTADRHPLGAAESSIFRRRLRTRVCRSLTTACESQQASRKHQETLRERSQRLVRLHLSQNRCYGWRLPA